MPGIWIIGGGRFGQIAAERMKRKHPHAILLAVDNDYKACVKLKQAGVDTVCMDGISFLSQFLSSKNGPDWIVPAAPRHVAYLWIRDKLLPDFHFHPEEVPESLLSQLPNPIKGKNKEVYMSVADFICPDNCPEPEKICTFTGKPRAYSLFERLGEAGVDPFVPVVIRSHQLAPGVGGYTPEMLFSALQKVKDIESAILFSSACRCHGVMNAFTLKKRTV